MYDATLEFEKKGRNNADGQYKLEVEYCQVLVEQVTKRCKAGTGLRDNLNGNCAKLYERV